jgi:hypothetical protein
LQYNDEDQCVIKAASGAVLGTYTGASSAAPSIEEDEGNTTEESPAADTATDLAYPQITELLPNPIGTGNDGTDEFIELYNPNTEPFPLKGYVLQTGVTTVHSYAFPDGAALAPGYNVFYAVDTNLSMSNTSGQARLLTPDGVIVAETAAYDGADDGAAWAFADGRWQWTTSPTPGAANTITAAVVAVKKTAVKSATTAKKTTAKKTTAKTAKAKTTKTTSSSKGVASEATQPVRGIHPLVLVGILLAAVGYGVYEHRQDLANAFYQFRSNRTARRSHRQ